ncbi:hypothetical protein NKJ06_26570 [Mesorhizobium sp. M0293]|uniref:hypothetical protein n=1 Tax=Mesorhizobium sp. M0293 TaxID=2956930 RepID=UPI00333A3A1B
MLVSIREVFWCRKCPISYSEKGDIDVQIGRRREASSSMSDFGQDRKSANPLFKEKFLLWHGPCMGFCERISETLSMIMRTEHAVAAVKTRFRLPSAAERRRVIVEAAIAPASKHLNGLESVRVTATRAPERAERTYVVAPGSRYDPSIVTALECSGLHSTTRMRWTNSRKPGRDRGSQMSAREPYGYGRYSPRTSRLVGRLYRRKQWSYLALGSVLGRLI